MSSLRAVCQILPALAVTLAFATVLAACSDDGTPATSSETSTTTTSVTASTTTTVRDVESDVLEAYQGYWRAILEANDPPDQSAPVLRRYATGEAFQAVFDATQANRVQNRAIRLPEPSVTEHRAEVLEVDATSATVRDCAIDDSMVVDLATGQVIDAAVVTRLGTAELVVEDGDWKVARTTVEETHQGVAGCAAA